MNYVLKFIFKKKAAWVILFNYKICRLNRGADKKEYVI